MNFCKLWEKNGIPIADALYDLFDKFPTFFKPNTYKDRVTGTEKAIVELTIRNKKYYIDKENYVYINNHNFYINDVYINNIETIKVKVICTDIVIFLEEYSSPQGKDEERERERIEQKISALEDKLIVLTEMIDNLQNKS
jgi:hypothetical protein